MAMARQPRFSVVFPVVRPGAVSRCQGVTPVHYVPDSTSSLAPIDQNSGKFVAAQDKRVLVEACHQPIQPKRRLAEMARKGQGSTVTWQTPIHRPVAE